MERLLAIFNIYDDIKGRLCVDECLGRISVQEGRTR